MTRISAEGAVRNLMSHPTRSRNHNWIAKELLKRDERGQYKGNSFTRKLSDKDRDEDIFQTARLINVGTFA